MVNHIPLSAICYWRSPGVSMNRTLSLFFTFALLLSACATPTAAPAPTKPPEPTPAPAAATPSGPVKITGSFVYTNDVITEYYAEHAVSLTDMTGFVKRDLEWEVPIKSQT